MSTIEKALERLKQGDSAAASSATSQGDGGGASSATSDVAPVAETHIAAPDVEKPAAPKSESRRLMLDLARLGRAGFLTPESGRSQLAEEMRHIKRPLLLNAFNSNAENRDSNLIMVTSSRPGEGKSFTSLNLAMSIAKERDKTVLLIDADVAKPGTTRLLGVETGAGLVDYLLGDSLSISDVLLKTNVPNLRFIPAGRRHHHSTELLASESMRHLTAELSDRYSDRIIIFDSPPLLATSEASVLAELVGQIVMIVESEKTSKQEVNEALELIGEDKVIGMVLNKARGSFGADYYGYYGGYGD